MWEQLIKKGYEITNKRILGNPAYTSEQTRHKDLVQELALIQDWLLNNYNHLVTVRPDKNKFRILLYFYVFSGLYRSGYTYSLLKAYLL